jgi:hypothetical protein
MNVKEDLERLAHEVWQLGVRVVQAGDEELGAALAEVHERLTRETRVQRYLQEAL